MDFCTIAGYSRRYRTTPHIDEFVRQYDRSSAASPLSIEFCLREEELQKALEHLESNNLLVLTGEPGVGKTRFALECCQRFVAVHVSFHVKCIYTKGPPLYEDIIAEVSPPGDYLLLVDDVNRVSDRQFIVNLLKGRTSRSNDQVDPYRA